MDGRYVTTVHGTLNSDEEKYSTKGAPTEEPLVSPRQHKVVVAI